MIKKIIFTSLIIIAIVFAGIGYFWYHHYTALHPSTDDAYVQANVVKVAARVPGQVLALKVQNHQQVKQGQLLFVLDPQPYQLAINQAKANLQQAQQQVASLNNKVMADQAVIKERQAQLHLAKESAKRIMPLVAKNYQAATVGDNTKAQLQQAQQALIEAQQQLKADQQLLGKFNQNGKIAAAKVALAQAQLNLKYTRVYAVQSGYISQLSLRAGDYVTIGQPLFTLIEKGNWWVNAFFREDQIANIRTGQKVAVKLDAYGNKIFQGVVQNISYASGTSFSLLPTENGSGNWVKVSQRFPVKIKLQTPLKNYPYRVGASAFVTVNIKS
jgi:membrane fusion protein, multidrug efflux system